MAILGYSTMGATQSGMGTGRMYASKFTLASAATLNELHGWFADNGASSVVRLVIYKSDANVSGVVGAGTTNPGTRVAYTNPLTVNGGTNTHLFQTGFSVALPAGGYYIGARSDVSGGRYRGDVVGGSETRGIDLGTSDPPPNPFGMTDGSLGTQLSCWAVVGPPAGPPAADFTGTPLTGAVPLSVAFTDASTGTPTSWLWDFGDGTTSTAQNPTHSFAAGGTYTVVLTATNASGSDTKTRTAYVTATEAIAYVTGGGVSIW